MADFPLERPLALFLVYAYYCKNRRRHNFHEENSSKNLKTVLLHLVVFVMNALACKQPNEFYSP